MPNIVKKEEALIMEGVGLKDIFKEAFLKKLEEKKLGVKPITAVFILSEDIDEKNKIEFPIILSHINADEIQKRILHINSENRKSSEVFIKLLGEFEPK